jgi:hypothetical protein
MADKTSLNLFNALTNDIKTHCILPFIPHNTLVWLNKENYNKYQSCIRKQIPDSLFESYIRVLVRKNHSFTLEHVVRENVQKWIRMKKYRYKNIIAPDYLHFIYYFAAEHKSRQSMKVIDNVAREMIETKWHKRNGVRTIRTKWTA